MIKLIKRRERALMLESKKMIVLVFLSWGFFGVALLLIWSNWRAQTIASETSSIKKFGIHNTGYGSHLKCRLPVLIWINLVFMVLNALIKTKNWVSPPWLPKDLVEMGSMALASWTLLKGMLWHAEHRHRSQKTLKNKPSSAWLRSRI